MPILQNLTYFDSEVNIMTGNGYVVNLLKFVWKILSKNISFLAGFIQLEPLCGSLYQRLVEATNHHCCSQNGEEEKPPRRGWRRLEERGGFRAISLYCYERNSM